MGQALPRPTRFRSRPSRSAERRAQRSRLPRRPVQGPLSSGQSLRPRQPLFQARVRTLWSAQQWGRSQEPAAGEEVEPQPRGRKVRRAYPSVRCRARRRGRRLRSALQRRSRRQVRRPPLPPGWEKHRTSRPLPSPGWRSPGARGGPASDVQLRPLRRLLLRPGWRRPGSRRTGWRSRCPWRPAQQRPIRRRPEARRRTGRMRTA